MYLLQIIRTYNIFTYFPHLTKHNILTEEQHGFRQCRSCETQLIATVHNLAENLNCGNQTDVILLDFTKAFDKVPHWVEKHLPGHSPFV